jgi:quercetin dioxygenase-like cupin family protein
MKRFGIREAALFVSIATVMARAEPSGTQAPGFERVQPELFASGGAFVNAWADYDSDGDLDQFVGFDGTPNRLYRNDGGRFVDAAAAAGIADARPTRAAAWGDADADGDPDLLVGFTPSPADAPAKASVLRFYRNTKGVFHDDTTAVGLVVDAGAVRQPVWVDYDGDQDLDLFVAFRDRANALYRNDAGRLIDIAAQVGLADTRRTVGAVWFDHDEDGDLDVVTGNMDGDANGLFSQDRGKFTDVASAAGVEWGGRTPQDKANGTVRPCVADVDNDGHLDLFFANYGKNGLFLNRRHGRFDNVSPVWGVAIDARYDSCAFADMDNDGDLDLYVNGTVTGGKQYDDYLFRNTGTTFENVTPANIGSPNGDHGVQWLDYDLDGDADLALTGVQKDGLHWLLRNNLPSPQLNRAMNIRVLDDAGKATLAGAEISLRVGNSSPVTWLHKRLVDAGSGYNSQSDAPVHVVLPTAGDITLNVTVRRAGSVTTSSFGPLNPDRARGRAFELRMPRNKAPLPQETTVVPVHQEPRHHLVHDSEAMRVLDIQIPPGDTTLFHTHSDPILYVTMSTSRTRNQNQGGEWSAPPAAAEVASAPPATTIPTAPTSPPGRMMSTTTYATQPQTHRVNNVGTTLFRLIGTTNSSAGDESTGASAGFEGATPEIANRWFRGYRWVLSDTPTAEHLHTNPVNVVVVAGSARVSMAKADGPRPLVEPGRFTVIPPGVAHSLQATAPGTQVLEIEVRRPQ